MPPGTDRAVTVASFLRHVLRGMCMGAADVVPGVSGGTMALILGIYERLVNAIRSFDLELLRLLAARRVVDAARHVDLAFLAALGLGILCALMFFTRVVPLPALIRSHPQIVYGLFFGLIVSSIFVLLHGLHPLRDARRLAWLALGVVCGLALVNLVPTQTPDDAWFVFLCGAIAISAMILPGVSGSFILLVLQKYAYVFDAVGRIDLAVLVPFALGCAVGLAAFSRVLNWMLRRFHDATMLIVVGVLIGSLWLIWPFQHREFAVVRGKERLIHSFPTLPERIDAEFVAALALALAGAALVAWLHRVAARQTSS